MDISIKMVFVCHALSEPQLASPMYPLKFVVLIIFSLTNNVYQDVKVHSI